jgi:hypothetical protein
MSAYDCAALTDAVAAQTWIGPHGWVGMASVAAGLVLLLAALVRRLRSTMTEKKAGVVQRMVR